jgi:crotonobetainyl-CoA:carnitine CoA-transferase CaiB-like acyl-CoA transferase
VYRQEGPDGEALVGINPPILLDGRRPAEMGRAPRLGEHTDELCGAASQRG